MRRKLPKNMTRAELLAEANKVGLSFARNVGTKKLIAMIEDYQVHQKDEQQEIGSVIDVEPMKEERRLAGRYELLVNVRMRGTLYPAGEILDLDEENARWLIKQGAVSVL